MTVRKRDPVLAAALGPHLRKIHTDMAILTSLWKEGRLEDPMFLEMLEEIAHETEAARNSFGGTLRDPDALPIYAVALYAGDEEMGMVGGPTPNLKEMLSHHPFHPSSEDGLDMFIVRIDSTRERKTTRLFRVREDEGSLSWERMAE